MDRKTIANSKRRLFFQNDGDDVLCGCDAATPEALLKVRTAPLVGSQVDAISYCTCQSFGLVLHNSRVNQVQTTNEGIYKKNIVKDLVAKGTDALEIMVNFAHAHSMELFWSIKMNDVHEGDPTHPELFPEFKKKHPDYLFGTLENRPTAIRDPRAWCGVDYGRAEVRERAFQTIAEVCERYDIDAVEMDFFRHPTFFKKQAWGESLGSEELGIMNGFMRRVRRMAEEVGDRRKRPILIAVRVPDSVDYCRKIGLDLATWLGEDLIDLLIAGGYFRFTPWRDTVTLGHGYGVPVYASLDESRMKQDAWKVRNSIECYRARAMEAWSAGIDGIYLFNLFDPRAPHWRELGDPRELEKLDKVYYVMCRGLRSANAHVRGAERLFTRSTLCPEAPVTLESGKRFRVSLPIGDNVMWGEAQGITPEIHVSLWVEGVGNTEMLSVTLNGEPIGRGVMSESWLGYRVNPALVKTGKNEIEILYRGNVVIPVIVHDAKMEIRYNKTIALR